MRVRVALGGVLAGVLGFLGSPGVRGQPLAAIPPAAVSFDPQEWLSPSAVLATPDGGMLFMACTTARQVAFVELASGTIIKRVAVPEPPSGLALSADGRRLYVTCAAPRSWVCVLDTASGETLATIPTGHTAMAPVLGPGESLLFVCNRFNNEVAVIDLALGKQAATIPVEREPVAAALRLDGRLLFVANHLHQGSSDREVVACVLSVIDTDSRKVLKHIALPNGSTLSRGVCVSPDGSYAAVTHVLARFHLPATQVEHGWMSNNALSLIDAAGLRLLDTVLLDDVDNGAANPWATAWSADGKWICVTHAGTHELSVIDATALLTKLAAPPAARVKTAYSSSLQAPPETANNLAFLAGLRRRVKLAGKGPRALCLAANNVFIANYFSDSVDMLDLGTAACKPICLTLQPPSEPSAIRRGEMLFNDGEICFQGWQSCASCHSSDGRIDGLNWDLTNDGIGNPKNVKSLLHSFATPPAMSLGVRSGAGAAVRAGIHHILFVNPTEEYASAIDSYVQSLQPVPSPHLQDGRLTAGAERGKALFFDSAVGCVECHPPPLFTNRKAYRVGTAGRFDQADDAFDTPSLVELWRTAPYLHDGSAATVLEAITVHNRGDLRGRTSRLTPEQIDDLVAYLLSL